MCELCVSSCVAAFENLDPLSNLKCTYDYNSKSRHIIRSAVFTVSKVLCFGSAIFMISWMYFCIIEISGGGFLDT